MKYILKHGFISMPRKLLLLALGSIMGSANIMIEIILWQTCNQGTLAEFFAGNALVAKSMVFVLNGLFMALIPIGIFRRFAGGRIFVPGFIFTYAMLWVLSSHGQSGYFTIILVVPFAWSIKYLYFDDVVMAYYRIR